MGGSVNLSEFALFLYDAQKDAKQSPHKLQISTRCEDSLYSSLVAHWY